jgi:hypothetical protein
MARFNLLYALPLAGLLCAAPVQAGQKTTLAEFVEWSPTAQVNYLTGVTDVLIDSGWHCPKRRTVSEILVSLQLIGRQSPGADLTTLLEAIGSVLGIHGCTAGQSTPGRLQDANRAQIDLGRQIMSDPDLRWLSADPDLTINP